MILKNSVLQSPEQFNFCCIHFFPFGLEQLILPNKNTISTEENLPVVRWIQ